MAIGSQGAPSRVMVDRESRIKITFLVTRFRPRGRRRARPDVRRPRRLPLAAARSSRPLVVKRLVTASAGRWTASGKLSPPRFPRRVEGGQGRRGLAGGDDDHPVPLTPRTVTIRDTPRPEITFPETGGQLHRLRRSRGCDAERALSLRGANRPNYRVSEPGCTVRHGGHPSLGLPGGEEEFIASSRVRHAARPSPGRRRRTPMGQAPSCDPRRGGAGRLAVNLARTRQRRRRDPSETGRQAAPSDPADDAGAARTDRPPRSQISKTRTPRATTRG